jgi:hypothetical protein
MPNTRKKVIIRTNAGAGKAETTLAGYLPLAGFVTGETVELLDLTGRVAPVPLAQVKTICYVREFNLADTVQPERLTRRSFLARPRSEGLWVRVTFLGGGQLEGLAALDLSLLDAMSRDRGLFLAPPDIRSNTQRLFVPHAAMAGLQLLAVITTPSKTTAASPKRESSVQNLLFPPEI